jgi:hypothetical protein
LPPSCQIELYRAEQFIQYVLYHQVWLVLLILIAWILGLVFLVIRLSRKRKWLPVVLVAMTFGWLFQGEIRMAYHVNVARKMAQDPEIMAAMKSEIKSVGEKGKLPSYQGVIGEGKYASAVNAVRLFDATKCAGGYLVSVDREVGLPHQYPQSQFEAHKLMFDAQKLTCRHFDENHPVSETEKEFLKKCIVTIDSVQVYDVEARKMSRRKLPPLEFEWCRRLEPLIDYPIELSLSYCEATWINAAYARGIQF